MISATRPSGDDRFAAVQVYLGSWEVMDALTGGIVANCQLQWESEVTDSEMEDDAKHRAEAIARHFNEIGVEWLAPLEGY